jgi:hypothetical protein
MATTRAFGTLRALSPAQKLLLGFFAGFIAVLLFHQPVLALLNQLGIAKGNVYSLRSTVPLGVPQVISLAFWGGVWGIVFAAIEHRFPRSAMYWVCAFLFGAIFPTLVAWFIVAPMKGLPLAGGWEFNRMLTGFLINGAWGCGTALLLVLGYRARHG